MSLSSFSAFALTRAEMKNVVGGTCLAEAAGPYQQGFSSLADAKAYATKYGGHYCCDSCHKASWVQSPYD